MKFSFQNCGVSAMKREIESECEGNEISNGEVMRQVGECESKYLDILDKVYFKEDHKERICQEFEVNFKIKIKREECISGHQHRDGTNCQVYNRNT